MVHYYIKIDPVPVNESGYVEGFNTRTLILDTSYSDKVEFSVAESFKYSKKRDLYEVSRDTFLKILNNAKRYNKKLNEVHIG